MKILYITPRPLGLIGTPGTYLSIERYAQKYELLVVSKKKKAHDEVVKRDFSYIKNIEFESMLELSKLVLELNKEFLADCICIASWGRWPKIVKELKAILSIPIFLEIKSPPLLEGKALVDIQSLASENQFLLDGIIALNKDIVYSWINNIRIPMKLHPLMVDTKLINFNAQKINSSNKIIKCIYVGSLNEKRQIKKLLKLVSLLDSEVRRKIQIDLYGSGENIADLESLSEEYEINKNIYFKGFIEQSQIYKLLEDYSIGLAWVPKDLYNTAPSLKLTEYICSGLVPIATDTNGHISEAEYSNILFFDEDNVDSLNLAFQKAIDSEFNYNKVDIQKHYSYERIADENLNFYNTIINSKNMINTTVEYQLTPKLMFISPRPFGLNATQGTYLMLEGYSYALDSLIVSNAQVSDKEEITYHASQNIKKVEIDYFNKNYIDQICENIEKFSPNLICIASWPNWYIVVQEIKKNYPTLKISLEIKSPLIATGERKEKLINSCKASIEFLNMLIAPSKDMALTWFGDNFDIPENIFLQHRQVLDYYSMSQNLFLNRAEEKIKFIFVGSITKNREIEKLLKLVSSLRSDILNKCQFDFYGDGNAKEELEEVVNLLGINESVEFKGHISQKELYQEYSKYDVGLAWVPDEHFNKAPSLKLLEYFAAGLIPLATNTDGHIFMKNYGFEFLTFDFSEISFQEQINNILEIHINQKYSKIKELNIKLAEKHHFLNVVLFEILPFYLKKIENPICSAWKKSILQEIYFEESNLNKMSNKIISEMILHQQKFKNKIGENK